ARWARLLPGHRVPHGRGLGGRAVHVQPAGARRRGGVQRRHHVPDPTVPVVFGADHTAEGHPRPLLPRREP
ncbi:unnamed protein product, partial [Heterosigma akashiwo]